MLVTCPVSLVDTTLSNLHEAGRRRCECVLLWLGRRDADAITIVEAYRPLQAAKEDMFHIPPEGMTALHDHLRRQRFMVAAQVHSHPLRAFHSQADDRWAIVRHEGALSLVVPNFARDTTVSNFLDQAKIYRFSADARWVEVPAHEQQSCLRIS